MGKISKTILGFLVFLLLGLLHESLLRISAFILDNLFIVTIEGWEWLQVYWRVLQDGLRSGYMRGTPFRTPDGHWAISWRLGGQPFIHVIFPYIFLGISAVATGLIISHLLLRYRSFSWFSDKIVDPKHFAKFRKSVSLSFIMIALIMSLVGITGTGIDPNMVIPAEPAKDYLGATVHFSATCSVTVTRFALIAFEPSVVNKYQTSPWLCCWIKTPENASWRITEIDESTILPNDTVTPFSAEISQENNGTAVMLLRFDTGLLSLGDSQLSQESRLVTLKVNGALKCGEFFAGSAPVTIEP